MNDLEKRFVQKLKAERDQARRAADSLKQALMRRPKPNAALERELRTLRTKLAVVQEFSR